jgi:hypothetical protein
VRPVEAAAATIERFLTDHPEVESRRLDASRWALLLAGRVRLQIPIAVHVGERTTVLTSFVLRGPRPPHGRPAELHRLLLRRNATTRRVHFALDRDDDVVLVSRHATAALDGEELDRTLAEILSVSESAFEPLVHLAYPGVFRPLSELTPPPAG